MAESSELDPRLHVWLGGTDPGVSKSGSLRNFATEVVSRKRSRGADIAPTGGENSFMASPVKWNGGEGTTKKKARKGRRSNITKNNLWNGPRYPEPRTKLKVT